LFFFFVTDIPSRQANAMGTGTTPSSSLTSTSTGSGSSRSASGYSNNAAIGFDSSKLAGTITLVAIIAGSFL
jgi:hypothetical protein